MTRGGKKIILTCKICGKDFEGPKGLMSNALKKHEGACRAKKLAKEGQGGKAKDVKEEKEQKTTDVEEENEELTDEEEEATLVGDNEEPDMVIDDDDDSAAYQCECGEEIKEGQNSCTSCGNKLDWSGL